MNTADILDPKYRKLIKQYMHETCRKSPEYKTLTKRAFRDVAGYASYKQVALELSAQLVTIPEGVRLGKPKDVTWSATTHSFWCAYHSPDFPVYALTKDLLRGFLDSDPPSQLWGLNRLFERALIMLPQDMIINPDGLNLVWIMIDFLEPYDDVKSDPDYQAYINSKFNQPVKQRLIHYAGIDSFRIRWTASLGLEYIYSATTQIPAPDEDPVPGFTSYAVGDAKTEQAFTNMISGLVFQILLYMARPRAIAEAVNPVADEIKKTKHQRRVDPKAPRNFIWVGNDYKAPRKPHQDGTHASPIGHPRRGHYRTLPWREIGNQEIWVRPAWIGGD